MATDLARIACGKFQDEGELSEILSHLGNSIDVFMGQLEWLAEQGDERVMVFGPFVGRSLLELSFTTIISRLDPFRVLYLREMQRQASFDIGVRRAASIQWQGDVLAREVPASNLWDHNRQFEKISRALLADYYGHIFWRTAFVQTLDTFEGDSGGEWLNELRNMEPERFIERMRAESTKLYSSLSKGIHPEFVIPPANLYDRATVASLLSDALRISSHMCLVSHQIAHCPGALDSSDILASYVSLQQIEVL